MSGIVHFEIPADDMKRAKTFYSNLFGWKIEGYARHGLYDDRRLWALQVGV